MENARPTDEKYVADVVEKKNVLSIAEKKLDESEVVAMTLPCAWVERSAFPMFDIARLVVVELVVVEFVALRLAIVEEEEMMMPTLVVGARAPFTSSNVLPNASALLPPLMPSDDVETHEIPEPVLCNT